MWKVCLQTFRDNRIFLKFAYFLRNLQTSWANNLSVFRIKNAKFSGHCFHINTNRWGDFQICISVPLNHVKANQKIVNLSDNCFCQIRRGTKTVQI